jgi:hypothetical protein
LGFEVDAVIETAVMHNECRDRIQALSVPLFVVAKI